MNNEKFAEMKVRAAKKALPHMVDPGRFGPPDLSLAECAVLVSRDAQSALTPAQVEAVERAALMKLGASLRAMGITSAAECIPVRRA